MGATQGIVSLLLAALSLTAHPAQAQNADLAVSVGVSKHENLRLGDEILVSTTVTNKGPGPSTAVFVSAGQAEHQPFVFELIGSESPECGDLQPSELNPPPQHTFFWIVGSIPAGGAVTCAIRLRVVKIPNGLSSDILADAYASNSAPDPQMANNFAQLTLGFASPRQPNTIPAGSWWAFGMIGLGVLLGAMRWPSGGWRKG